MMAACLSEFNVLAAVDDLYAIITHYLPPAPRKNDVQPCFVSTPCSITLAVEALKGVNVHFVNGLALSIDSAGAPTLPGSLSPFPARETPLPGPSFPLNSSAILGTR